MNGCEQRYIKELEQEVKRLERLLMTETPIEERRGEALKLVKRYTEEYGKLREALEKIRHDTKHAKSGFGHNENNLANIHEIAGQALEVKQ